MLYYLIADLARQPKLRTRFDANAEEVLEEYGIAHDVRPHLLRRDLAKLELQLHSEASQVLLKLMPSRVFYWPGNILQLKSISPTSVQAGAATPFTATGEMFAPDATLTFTRPGVTVAATDVVVRSIGLESVLTGTATFTVAGAYDVTVANPGSGQSGTLPGAVTVSGK